MVEFVYYCDCVHVCVFYFLTLKGLNIDPEHRVDSKGLPRNKLVNLTDDLCRYTVHMPI